jgi:arabinoxylan arabinofuranohydrolase
MRILQLGADMISTIGSAVQLTGPHFFEDSWFHRYNGKYYYSYSTNWDNGAPTIDYMMSSSPMSGYQHVGTTPRSAASRSPPAAAGRPSP